MPRVTEIIGYLTEPELLAWIERTSKAKRKAIQEAAMSTGSIVDEIVQEDLRDGGYDAATYGDAVQTCLSGWEKFKKDRPDIVAGIDRAGMQRELERDGITGHPDFPVFMEDRWGIIDLKCASGIRPNYWTQTAKYTDLWPSPPPLPRFIGILRLDKREGTYEYVEITDEDYIQYELKVFEAYLVAFNHNTKNREAIRRVLEEEALYGV